MSELFNIQLTTSICVDGTRAFVHVIAESFAAAARMLRMHDGVVLALVEASVGKGDQEVFLLASDDPAGPPVAVADGRNYT